MCVPRGQGKQAGPPVGSMERKRSGGHVKASAASEVWCWRNTHAVELDQTKAGRHSHWVAPGKDAKEKSGHGIGSWTAKGQ